MTRAKRLPIGTHCLVQFPTPITEGSLERTFVHDKRSYYGPMWYGMYEHAFHNELVRIVAYHGNDYHVKSLSTNRSCWMGHQLLTPVSFKEL